MATKPNRQLQRALDDMHDERRSSLPERGTGMTKVQEWDVRQQGGRPRQHAVAVAVTALFVVSGLTYRAYSAWLDRAPSHLPFERDALSALPLQLGPWEGVDRDIDELLVRAADVDAYLHRRYIRASDHSEVAVWVAFGVRTRDLAPHRPAVCYPSAGWGLQRQRNAAVDDVAGESLPVKLFDFESPHLDGRPITVLNYYVVDGRTLADIAELRAVSWKAGADLTYVAQVQLTVRSGAQDGEAERRSGTLRDFVREFQPALLRTLSAATLGRAPVEGSGS